MNTAIQPVAGVGQPDQRTTAVLPARLPVYIRIPLFIVMLTTAVLVGWITLIWQNGQAANPFADYEDLFPGQPQSNAMAQTFSCLANAATESSKFCTYAPAGSPFSFISITLSDHDVKWLDFTVRDDTLTIGDLARLWGRPQIRLHHAANFDWPDLGISAAGWTEGSEFTYFIPISRVSLTTQRTT
jgi:hypothetical protein